MSWTAGKPQDTWKDSERMQFLREFYTRLKFGSFTWNPPSIGANTTVDTTLTTSDSQEFSGLRAGMAVVVTPPSTLDTGISCGGAYVANDSTLTIRLANNTAAPINPTTATWLFMGMVV